ncbi:phosphoribosyl 1,2-cyclic phosphodiesterase [Chitinophaga polysaccharea]|uniref:Phosphoribosyl 1,2-cyclic phosphodiesterase n=1 Tax=Chitinophaga polysaccharea TaxID=1293035 RepID=A0A561PNU2_9BACT|nr:MBL fold metallo-hydrolase [Chitinophaga polysaccharea]TWF39784.1 phosphoribosyl 1,2-cyclic phosphodiesterase [Chitinophaga polysaccharea]
MSLFITSLNSGSNGNCYYIGNDSEAVLIDAGISCRETEKRMTRLGLSMKKVKAIFISHEHSDHIRGVEVLAKKYRLPVYITPGTLTHGGLSLDAQLVVDFNPYEAIQVGNLSVTAFPKHHDASEPHSFVVSGNAVTIGIFTDIGAPCEHVVRHFQQCHAAFLEANYDEEMLEKGRYPYYLKNRIRGGKGHLSNRQALEIFTAHRPAFMSHLLLSHLSRDNNSPDLVQALFDEHANGTQIIVASRYQETAVFTVNAANAGEAIATTPPPISTEALQGKLF